MLVVGYVFHVLSSSVCQGCLKVRNYDDRPQISTRHMWPAALGKPGVTLSWHQWYGGVRDRHILACCGVLRPARLSYNIQALATCGVRELGLTSHPYCCTSIACTGPRTRLISLSDAHAKEWKLVSL